MKYGVCLLVFSFAFLNADADHITGLPSYEVCKRNFESAQRGEHESKEGHAIFMLWLQACNARDPNMRITVPMQERSDFIALAGRFGTADHTKWKMTVPTSARRK
jgi:hypothetical protein